MNTFVNRLKEKDVLHPMSEDIKQKKLEEQNKAPVSEDTSVAEQLKVDIFQTADEIIIYSQVAGAHISDFGVYIEGDGDVVTIKGQRKRPNGEFFGYKSGAGPAEHIKADEETDGIKVVDASVPHHEVEEKETLLEECSWGRFYRQIILPAEVDATKTEAKFREGVLKLILPLKSRASSGIRVNITEIKS